MNSHRLLRRARFLQFAGIIIAVLGLAGFWINRDVPKAQLTEEQRDLLGIEDDEFHASFLVAGKDIWYEQGKSSPVYGRNGQIVRWIYSGKKYADGTNTDTILYVNIKGNDVTMIGLPRDIYLPQWQTKINAMYYYKKVDGLKQSVEEILGLPIDYYAIIDTTIFANLVDALGGVEVNIPQPMHYDDNAGDLHIHFEPGMTYLNGEDAAKFIRFRHSSGGDLDRLDNLKRLANALLVKVKDMNVRAVTKLPQIIDVFFEDVETNVSPALIKELLPRLGQIKLSTATLPVILSETSSNLSYDPVAVNKFLAETFGGEAKNFAEAPDLTLLITNRSGTPGLEDLYKEELLALGFADENILIREASEEGVPTYLLADQKHWGDADYFDSLFLTHKQQIDRLPIVDGEHVGLELVLGADANQTMLAKKALAAYQSAQTN
ncbi:MAG: LCP family protein [Trueperaceae bacterium]|nr:LCP family protein [Trueperaceae bacterium]